MAETLQNEIHVIALGSRDPEETLEFSTLTNELGEGYFDEVLFGSPSGTRAFSWKFPVLDMNTESCTLDGVDYKPAEYLFELFKRQKTRGELFAVRSPINNQFYLCRFADSSLTLTGIYTRLFTGAAMFRQVRREGVTVFDPIVYPIARILENWTTPISGATDGGAIPSGEWVGRRSTPLEASTGVTYQTNEQNGLAVLRLDDAGGADSLTENTLGTQFAEVFIVLKVRAATFTGTEAIFGDGTTEILQGAGAGTTRFANQSFTGYEYRLNGQSLAQTAQTAPMNAFGVAHVRRSTPWTWGSGWRFTGNVDIGEIIVALDPLPRSIADETTEYLLTKWGI